jgi:hypothetical protein
MIVIVNLNHSCWHHVQRQELLVMGLHSNESIFNGSYRLSLRIDHDDVPLIHARFQVGERDFERNAHKQVG